MEGEAAAGFLMRTMHLTMEILRSRDEPNRGMGEKRIIAEVEIGLEVHQPVEPETSFIGRALRLDHTQRRMELFLHHAPAECGIIWMERSNGNVSPARVQSGGLVA